MLVLLANNTLVKENNPYVGTNPSAANQAGFCTFGPPELFILLAEVTLAALKSVWYEKWNVHRRLRPEQYGGHIDRTRRGITTFPVNAQVLSEEFTIFAQTFAKNGSYLLPQAYTESSPSHPSYASGHAAMGGACATIIKAWFKETHLVPNPVQANATGEARIPCPDPLTVGGEITKLAANISIGRNWAGIHFRTDAVEGMKLGEQVAIGVLRSHLGSYSEQFSAPCRSFCFFLCDSGANFQDDIIWEPKSGCNQ